MEPHFIDARILASADIVVVAEAPVVPRVHDVSRIHTPFGDDAGAIVRSAIEEVRRERQEFASARVRLTYAVLCTGLDPNKETVQRCGGFLGASIKRATEEVGKPPVVIAMGAGAARALGIKAKSQRDLQSRVLPGIDIGGLPYTVIPTVSTKMLVSKTGLYNTFLADLRRAYALHGEGCLASVPLSELTRAYVFPKTVEEVRSVCEQIESYAEAGTDPAKWSISVDTETNTKFPHRPTTKIIAISFAWGTGKATCIPLWHPEAPYDPERVVPYVLRVLNSPKPKILHHGKYDMKVLMSKGWTLENWVWDGMLGEHVLEEDKKGQYGLKQLTRVFHPEFAAYADKVQELLTEAEGETQLENVRKTKGAAEAKPKKKGKKKGMDGGFEKIPLDDLLLYGAVDADMTRRIASGQVRRMAEEELRVNAAKKLADRDRFRPYPVPRLCKHPSPSKAIVRNISVPVSKVLAKMEYDGIRVDRVYLEDLYGKLEKVIDDTERELYRLAGKELKLNHARTVANLLFSEGFIHPETGKRTYYPSESRTAKGQDQTTEKVLKALVKKYACPFSAKKLIYGKAYKARNTFCRNVLDLAALDGRLHTSYHVHGTGTGRLSSSDENMQNIPSKLAGFSIKKIFVPTDSSMAFVNCDARSAEIKGFAAYSRDGELIRALNDGLDTHAFFAAKIVEEVRRERGAAEVLRDMGLSPEYPFPYEDFAGRDEWKVKCPPYGEMLDKFRTAVKRVVFGILYGAGPSKIAETIGITRGQAQAIIDMLFRMFPSIPRYIESTKWELWQFGCVETYFGRRRRCSIRGLKGYLRSQAERRAVNFKIQSTTSDLVLDRLVDVAEPLERDLRGRLLLTVHDSIGFELPKRYLSQLPDFVEEYLVMRAGEKHRWLPVPFTWDLGVGDSMGELRSYGEYMKGIPKEEIRDELEEAYSEDEIREDLASVEAA